MLTDIRSNDAGDRVMFSMHVLLPGDNLVLDGEVLLEAIEV